MASNKKKIKKAIATLEEAAKEDEVYSGAGDYNTIMSRVYIALEILRGP